MADMPRASPRLTVFQSSALKLSDIRGDLIRLEETIIFALIERAQFHQNLAIYRADAEGLLGDHAPAAAPACGAVNGGSYVGSFLLETEKLHAQMGRYTSPDEHAFFPSELPSPILPHQSYPSVLKPNTININPQIATMYLSTMVPRMCDAGDDAQYGSSAVCDIAVLQALSKRIHYGKFVAEAKFQADVAGFTALIEAGDADGIMAALTKPDVEAKVVQRVLDKASRYGLDPIEGAAAASAAPGPPEQGGNFKVDPSTIAALYRDYLIPLNKDVQVAYLLRRLDRPTFAYVDAGANDDASNTDQAPASLAAAQLYFGASCEGVGFGDVAAVVDAVRSNRVAHGIVALELRGEGTVRRTQRAILNSPLMVFDSFRGDPKDTCARYLVLQAPSERARSAVTTKARVLLTFGVRHEPGALRTALDAIGVSLSMCCLESIKVNDGKDANESEAAFWCELARGDSTNAEWESRLTAALGALEAVTTHVRFIGSCQD